jgi:hypothetical protein
MLIREGYYCRSKHLIYYLFIYSILLLYSTRVTLLFIIIIIIIIIINIITVLNTQ